MSVHLDPDFLTRAARDFAGVPRLDLEAVPGDSRPHGRCHEHGRTPAQEATS